MDAETVSSDIQDEEREPSTGQEHTKRSKGTGDYEKIASALLDIRTHNISIRKASEKYGIPRSTLHDRLTGKVGEGPRAMGPNPYLTREEETEIARWCINLSKCGFPIKQDDLLNTVQKIIKDENRQTPFRNHRPGRTWLKGFFRRNPELAKKEAESITKGRACVTEEFIRKWFNELVEYLKSENHESILEDPQRMLNGDESSFNLCPKTGKVIGPKGYKNVYQIQPANEKETLTVLLVFSAHGKLLPPMVVFPYLRPPKDIVNSMPPKWFLGRTESGWMRSETFV